MVRDALSPAGETNTLSLMNAVLGDWLYSGFNAGILV